MKHLARYHIISNNILTFDKGFWFLSNHFYLIRHGETDWNMLRKLQGHTNIPLNGNGFIQAQKIAKRLSTFPLKLVCTSDLDRAKQTANQIIKHHTIGQLVEAHEFRERNYGEWEGLHIDEIKRLYPEYRQGAPLGGKYGIESLENMHTRALRKMGELIATYPNEHIAIVSHGGMINALLHRLSNGLYGTGITKLTNTSFNHISYHNGEWTIHLVNDSSHLDDL